MCSNVRVGGQIVQERDSGGADWLIIVTDAVHGLSPMTVTLEPHACPLSHSGCHINRTLPSAHNNCLHGPLLSYSH